MQLQFCLGVQLVSHTKKKHGLRVLENRVLGGGYLDLKEVKKEETRGNCI
jgi:hypothetical protein